MKIRLIEKDGAEVLLIPLDTLPVDFQVRFILTYINNTFGSAGAVPSL